MLALDSSALVRYLTNDVPSAARRVGAAIDGDQVVAVPALVLLETVHVLRGRPYMRQNPDLADALVDLLAHENIRLIGLDSELASAAIREARDRSPRHLADALIAASAVEGGATRLLTTDRAFASPLVPVEQLA